MNATPHRIALASAVGVAGGTYALYAVEAAHWIPLLAITGVAGGVVSIEHALVDLRETWREFRSDSRGQMGAINDPLWPLLLVILAIIVVQVVTVI